MSGMRLRAVAAMLLVSNYFDIVGRILEGAANDVDAPGAPLPWRLPAAVALAYAACAAAFWFVGRLERRRLPDGHGARWEKGVKVAAHVLAHAIVGVLTGYLASVTPLALYVFMWVGWSTFTLDSRYTRKKVKRRHMKCEIVNNKCDMSLHEFFNNIINANEFLNDPAAHLPYPFFFKKMLICSLKT
ncbi:hypothetical protein C2845_PM05G25880 [Panicum miliaceum]|uniref:Uncharacterized protein n=1 Tax=Panicum miliaceum TaxID=4540 RepID=A0A3L6T505_PANMI|nr:hypothetical protein C2845_PM05G25880 [Panicum miliaceum]